MTSAIVIGTHPGSPWLAGCLASFPQDVLDRWPLLVVRNEGFELGKIRWVYDRTDIEEFLFLPDSTEIVGDGWWISEILNDRGMSYACNSDPLPGGSYMMKYRRDVLDRVSIRDTPTKRDAVREEIDFHRDYCARVDPCILWPEMRDGGAIIERHGQRRMVLEAPGLRKFKGCWSPEMAE